MTLGLATIFDNCEAAGYPNVPVGVEGSSDPLKRGEPRVADFVHGSFGLGNLFLPSPNFKKIDKSASKFLVEKVFEYPGEVSILALGPLTNLALAVKMDSMFVSKVTRAVQLSDSFFALGNVNPAAETNVAAVVFTSGANIDVVGIYITKQVKLKDWTSTHLRTYH
uniref:Inosine/uridine-preferring nucleoside hydrolase domain-containing protein n=1 Tax=Solanum lycopersicum TaxID=4081 RepID=K4BZF6_SOLLC